LCTNTFGRCMESTTARDVCQSHQKRNNSTNSCNSHNASDSHRGRKRCNDFRNRGAESPLRRFAPCEINHREVNALARNHDAADDLHRRPRTYSRVSIFSRASLRSPPQECHRGCVTSPCPCRRTNYVCTGIHTTRYAVDQDPSCRLVPGPFMHLWSGTLLVPSASRDLLLRPVRVSGSTCHLSVVTRRVGDRALYEVLSRQMIPKNSPDHISVIRPKVGDLQNSRRMIRPRLPSIRHETK